MKQTRLTNIYLGFISLVLLIVVLVYLKDILVPFVIALLISVLLISFIESDDKTWIKILKVSLTIGGFGLFIFIFTTLLYNDTSNFVSSLPLYNSNLESGLNQINSLFARLPFNFSLKYEDFMVKSFDSLTSLMSGAISGVLFFIGKFFLILVFVIFILAGRVNFNKKISKFFSSKKAKQYESMFREIEAGIKTYLGVKSFVSLLTALFSALILWLFGADFIIVSALFIFILNFVPNFGSIIATLVPISFYLLKYGFIWQFVVMSLCLFLIQFYIGNIVEPRLSGKGLNLSPLVVLLALMFWGSIWGIQGMLLSVPLTSVIKIVLSKFKSTEIVSEFMG